MSGPGGRELLRRVKPFIGALALSHIEAGGHSSEIGSVKITAAKAAADPPHALEVLRVECSSRAMCPARETVN